jgi:hypothetical protein
VYVYYFGGMPVAIQPSTVNWHDRAGVYDCVLGVYAGTVYNTYLGGDLGRLYGVAGSGVHGTYQLVLAVALAAFIAICWLLWEEPLQFVETMGKALVVSGFISYAVLMLISGLAVGSWVNAVSSPAYQEALPIVVSGVTGQFQSICMLYFVAGAIMWGGSLYAKSKGY